MLKWIQFHTLRPGATLTTLRETARRVADAPPPELRPVRIALCATLPDVIADQPHDAVTLVWFADLGHWHRFADWWRSAHDQGPESVFDEQNRPGQQPAVLLAEEAIGRGPDWLESRWQAAGPKIKHMAIAKRAAGLTPDAFSELWRSRAGTVKRDDGAAMVIPDAAKGLAYIQNHPAWSEGDDWVYDAVNEVYFDDIPTLQIRIDYFAEAMSGDAENDLVSTATFLAVREEPVYDATN